MPSFGIGRETISGNLRIWLMVSPCSAARHTAHRRSVPSLASALEWTGWDRWWQQRAILRTCVAATLSNLSLAWCAGSYFHGV